MKNLGKRLIVSISLLAIVSLFNCGGVHAALQANDGTPATKTVQQWLLQVRQMESAGGTLGKAEDVNSSNLLATSASNGFDCHMEKNTEYGAMVILSASAYGKPTKVNNGETTTGNETGVKMNINKEWVAAYVSTSYDKYFNNPNSRYVNNDYTNSSGGKYHTGDAMNIGGWHGSGATTWLDTRDYQSYVPGIPAFIRSYSGSIFSYYGAANGGDAQSYGTGQRSWASRAVVVIGENL